jgi:hypothetical protein
MHARISALDVHEYLGYVLVKAVSGCLRPVLASLLTIWA